jgi:hypothetical protein
MAIFPLSVEEIFREEEHPARINKKGRHTAIKILFI